MAKRKLNNQLISKNQITEEIRFIQDSDNYYISENGNVYVLYEHNMFLKKKLYQNKENGYMYCGIKYNGRMKATRVHRLVAIAFIQNLDKTRNIIGHKDNIKTNNRVDNLY